MSTVGTFDLLIHHITFSLGDQFRRTDTDGCYVFLIFSFLSLFSPSFLPLQPLPRPECFRGAIPARLLLVAVSVVHLLCHRFLCCIIRS